jgi:hypothetical protein
MSRSTEMPTTLDRCAERIPDGSPRRQPATRSPNAVFTARM